MIILLQGHHAIHGADNTFPKISIMEWPRLGAYSFRLWLLLKSTTLILGSETYNGA